MPSGRCVGHPVINNTFLASVICRETPVTTLESRRRILCICIPSARKKLEEGTQAAGEGDEDGTISWLTCLFIPHTKIGRSKKSRTPFFSTPQKVLFERPRFSEINDNQRGFFRLTTQKRNEKKAETENTKYFANRDIIVEQAT